MTYEWAAVPCVSLFVAANLFLLDPLTVLRFNQAEFGMSLRDMLPVLAGACIAFAGVLTLVGLLIPRSHRFWLTTMLLTLGAMLWIQSSFLRWEYGELDGTPIDWSQFKWQPWVDGAIWLLVFGAAARFARPLSRLALFIALAFLTVQSAVQLAKARVPPATTAAAQESDRVLPPQILQLSKTRNVFQFIMDSYQTDVFMELVEEEDLSNVLDGFVVYEENLSTGTQTILSVPALFSTQIYDGTEPESVYYRKAKLGSFHRLLFREGYIVNLMPWTAMDHKACTNQFATSGPYAEPRRTRVTRTAAYLFDISLFRQSPHFAKRFIYNDQNWRLSKLAGKPPGYASVYNKALLRDYINGLEAVHVKPAYHFVHVMPPHPPFVTLADGSFADEVLPHTRENYKTEARYMLRLFVQFLEKLKDMGLYDSSIILLHGDHGAGWSSSPSDSLLTLMSRVSALLLFKPAQASGALVSSRAQTSLTDIPATLLDLLGVEHNYPGESILSMDESQDRTRDVVVVTEKESATPGVRRWEVTGSAYDATSWRELERRVVERRARPYEWGTHLKFGLDGNGEPYLGSGWSTTAALYSWNDGESAQILFAIEQPGRDVSMEIVLFPYVVPGKVDRQRIKIDINGNGFAELEFSQRGAQKITAVVPRGLLKSGIMELSFEFPDAVSPTEVGAGADPRRFAVQLISFKTDLVPQGISVTDGQKGR